MADCLEIKYNPSAGRHGIAADNISPGEIILIEDPVAWTVNPNQFSSVCQNCACQVWCFSHQPCLHNIYLQVGRTPFPSPRHEAAVFCSYTCLTQFHRIFGKYDDLPFVELFASGGAEGSASLMLAFRFVSKLEFLNVNVFDEGVLFKSHPLGTLSTKRTCFLNTMKNTGLKNQKDGSLRVMRIFTKLFSTWSIISISSL